MQVGLAQESGYAVGAQGRLPWQHAGQAVKPVDLGLERYNACLGPPGEQERFQASADRTYQRWIGRKRT